MLIAQSKFEKKNSQNRQRDSSSSSQAALFSVHCRYALHLSPTSAIHHSFQAGTPVQVGIHDARQSSLCATAASSPRRSYCYCHSLQAPVGEDKRCCDTLQRRILPTIGGRHQRLGFLRCKRKRSLGLMSLLSLSKVRILLMREARRWGTPENKCMELMSAFCINGRDH